MWRHQIFSLALVIFSVGSGFVGSQGYVQDPSQINPVIAPIGGTVEYHRNPPKGNVLSPTSFPTGPVLPLPTALPPNTGHAPPVMQGPIASSPSRHSDHQIGRDYMHSRGMSPSTEKHTSQSPNVAVPIASSPIRSPVLAPVTHSGTSATAPTIPIAYSPSKSATLAPVSDPKTSGTAPTIKPDQSVPPVSISPFSSNGKRHGVPFAAPPPLETVKHLSSPNNSPTEGSSPFVSSTPQEASKPPQEASKPPNTAPSESFPWSKPAVIRRVCSPSPAPSSSPSFIFPMHHPRRGGGIPALAPSKFPPHLYHQGLVVPASHAPTAPSWRSRQRLPRPPLFQGPALSPIQSPFSPTRKLGIPASSPSLMIPSVPTDKAAPPPFLAPSASTDIIPSPFLHIPPKPSETASSPSSPTESPISVPTVYPGASPPQKEKVPVQSPIRALPPPPPNVECSPLACTEPLTNSPPGSPCDCVWPMKVGLRLSVALYTFFPLVSELASEIAMGIFMKQSQVRIMGANAASQDPEKTIVLIDLVPLGKKFDNTTAFLTFEKFWRKQVLIKASFFGDYEVLYVNYPGLPPSPPSASSGFDGDAGQFANTNNARMMHPLGVDVRKRKERLGSSLIAVIVLSSSVALLLCVGIVWAMLWNRGRHYFKPPPTPQDSLPPIKPSAGAGPMVLGSWPSSAASASLSFSSSIAAYTGSAKTFSIGEIERATDNFNNSTILGEGGFGCVYKGILEDGTTVAVKVLKREDQQGGREFLAEVEMLSRLHHRNLVRLIGICTEEHCRCLVYELVPNGSVESHLHGVHKESSPLDWGARMKIALGSARGLAYLHEDSSPRVIHRDFKSSNILLEYDFTPKVSDFGLARTALDGRNEHISTRVMGTFGYVAPEYAMTGHLLVKSDVYSYGVVLLELLTGRKPVDMSRPLGQENLVTWARPLLTSKEGLEMIVDPALGPNFPFDSVAKVAAIASMCVQPEVSHRPFMGEVVQALKLVCNETDEKKAETGSCSQEDSSAHDVEARVSNASGHLQESRSFLAADYDSGIEAERALSTSDIFTTARFMRRDSGSFRRHSSSGPLRTRRSGQSWLAGLSRGSVSEHGRTLELWEVLDSAERWP